MLNADKSIKNSTDRELQEMLSRVRQEREALRLIRGVKLLSEPNQKGPYPKYFTLEAFSTETPVNNGKSIKEMSNEELVDFIQRLRNEEDLMQVVRDIKEMNNPRVSSEEMGWNIDKETYEGIDLNTPVKDLYHFGVLGMRWGHRKTSISTSNKTSNDKDLARADRNFEKKSNIRKVINKATVKMNMSRAYIKESESVYEDVIREFGNRPSRVIENMYQDRMVSVVDRYMKADPTTYNPSKTSRVAFSFVQVNGNNYMTPTIVPADSVMHKEATQAPGDLFVLGIDGKITLFSLTEESEISHEEIIDRTLEHFGIPGMRWGVRRARGASGRVSTSSEDHLTSRQLKKKKVKELSNAELKALNNRLNLERNLRDLKISDSQKGLEFVKTITAVGTTLAAAYALSETPLGKATVSVIKGKLKKGG